MRCKMSSNRRRRGASARFLTAFVCVVCDTSAFQNAPIPSAQRAHTKEDKQMKKILSALLSVLFVFTFAVAMQNTNSSTTSNSNASKPKGKAPFRADKEQIKQAQSILKQRGFYAGEQTGKINPDTRAGLRKYQ